MADMEDKLRKLRDRKNELDIDNRNLEMIVNTESGLRQTKNTAEASAVRAVNDDLKDHIARLQQSMNLYIPQSEDSRRLQSALNNKYESASQKFEKYLRDSEAARDRTAQEFEDMQRKLQDKKGENDQIRADIKQNEVQIESINDEIQKLNDDIERMKRKNDQGLQMLERDRQAAIGEITDLRARAVEVEHEYNRLSILVEKSKMEIEYLNSEREKKSGGNYQAKVESFQRAINTSDKRTKTMQKELTLLQRTVQKQIERSINDGSKVLRASQNEESSQIIKDLQSQLRSKKTDLTKITQKRDHLRSTHQNTVSDDQLQIQLSELDEQNRQLLSALDQKNALYDEIAENTKVLQNLNITLETNVEKTAKLKQEIEFMKTEFEEKDRVMNNIQHDVDSQRNMLFELKDEVRDKEEYISDLTEQLRKRTREESTIEKEIREKDDVIRDLEEQLAGLQRRSSPSPKKKSPKRRSPERRDQGDEVDVLFRDYLNQYECDVPLQKLGDGYYVFGTRKIYAKVMNGQLVVRVGGGYQVVDEFIQNYEQTEKVKLDQMLARGEDPYEKYASQHSSSHSQSHSQKERSRRSKSRGKSKTNSSYSRG